MAAITRRIFEGLRDEHMRRVGRANDSNYTSRAQEFVTAAYYDICHLFHHHELDALDTTILFSTSNPYITLPANCHIVIAFQARAVGTGLDLGTLIPIRSTSLFAQYNPTAGSATEPPHYYARHGGRLYFNQLPGAAFLSTLYYYQIPDAPDFATGTVAAPRISMLKWVYDEHIIDLSVARAKGAAWLPELAAPDHANLKVFLEQTPEMLLSQALLIERPADTGEQPVGGVQG